MGRPRERWAVASGVVGHIARGVVFAMVGVFLAKAAIEYDPSEAVGIDGALAQAGRRSPTGPGCCSCRGRRAHRLRRLLHGRGPVPADLTPPGAVRHARGREPHRPALRPGRGAAGGRTPAPHRPAARATASRSASAPSSATSAPSWRPGVPLYATPGPGRRPRHRPGPHAATGQLHAPTRPRPWPSPWPARAGPRWPARCARRCRRWWRRCRRPRPRPPSGWPAGSTSMAARRHDRPPAARTAIEQALVRSQVVEIDYRDRHGARHAARGRADWRSWATPRHWYLVGHCRLRDGVRAFRLDRVAAARLTGEPAPDRAVRARTSTPARPPPARPLELTAEANEHRWNSRHGAVAGAGARWAHDRHQRTADPGDPDRLVRDRHRRPRPPPAPSTARSSAGPSPTTRPTTSWSPPAPTTHPGGIQRHRPARPTRRHPARPTRCFYVQVADVRRHRAPRSRRPGGKIQSAPPTAPDGLVFAYVDDPAGNTSASGRPPPA